ncbi:chromosome segregation protein SMC [Shewanella fidelis]|uniref:Chromosome partition protein Smc n=1 Tax=Shewanella fidelis TaxID=173509 RepID=A0AAW8NNN8_9GAMM|nr:chromosome segregation protein SMC [Shewanella fidelis]MDR8523429.1 chromosome segregation protein SMC [Shewanella fidelis]MDW4813337.1 chromosome segregation protein SMC [Shewanella fidelis]MDW4817291.1 chromosome segregation protein SMC [Shewanella fidelis]MDW4821352.1 chromosome segregation protein SMC [Shewanella fidelis]MDW4824570.1 chromosome segregation protein SMC [Shewanella fidelis]
MRLKQIKLAGFKSFVDPTKIPFPNPLSAIIGPNGCGKSNVIDAVRWVLGESSAKHLRGDSMADVIFNGSTARRPVSVASVELIFDNQDGRLLGQYSSYQEVAVKRQVSRDGDSNYFLNNQKCRRKDITDLFMGTGLGPRSYAIIEQGTISRLIESKPQELRVFIEEAAGISRYKERRRETENRIRHTRENLARLGDIRSELAKQLEKLAEQAETAKKYRELKQAERKCDAELSVSRYHELTQQIAKIDAELAKLELQHEQFLAENQTLELKLTELTLKLSELDAQEAHQVEDFYLTKTHIAKLEQSLKHRQLQDESLAERLQEVAAQLQAYKVRCVEDQAKQAELVEQQNKASPDLVLLRQQLAEFDRQVSDASHILESLTEQTNELNDVYTQANLKFEMNRTQLGHHQTSIESKLKLISRVELQAETLKAELEQLTSQDLSQQVDALSQVVEQEQEIVDELKYQLANVKQQEQSLLIEQDTLKVQLADEQGRLAVVTSLLPTDTPDNEQALWQVLEVTPGWESAVDILLSGVLNTPVHASGEYPVDVDSAQTIAFGFIGGETDNGVIRAPANLAPWLNHVTWLATLNEALLQRGSLKQDELIATADGYLVGHDFIVEKAQATGSIVELKSEQVALELSTETKQDKLVQLNNAIAELKHALQPLTEQIEQKQQFIQAKQIELASFSSQLRSQQQSINDASARFNQTQQELLETKQELKQLQFEVLQANELQQQLKVQLDKAVADKTAVQAKKSKAADELAKLRPQRQQLDNKLSQLSASEHQLQTQLMLIAQQLEQHQQRIDEFEQTQSQLRVLQSKDETLQDGEQQPLSVQLEQALTAQKVKQDALAQIRLEQAAIQELCDSAGTNKKQQLAKLENLTQASSTLKLRREGLKGQIDSQQRILDEQSVDVAQVLSTLDDNKTTLWRQKELERLRAQIAHLGAINLAAIEEFELQNQRKCYLDSQDDDLNAALSSLEEAIRKIDKETKSRFKETFDKVNADLGLLFPKVFGGGSAYLALTDDDLLETGVTIMARPPGKKNSTIHLLSGGEKALTALSLVFAIFRLNPAPFCMLDEVDAPLDDANVERFCRLVKEMSQSVQFIYISHNKITMELADQLIGVTMHEPGVSRIVAVDIDEAVALADAG